ncbi:BTB/POZ domain-containing protein [Perilla frutescens var. frutescens]|nr:BTB/POZ domain-containing protein [Perilla frutescens var. frutescens]
MNGQSSAATSAAGERIKLNVGGKLFETTVSTLRSGGPDSLLYALSNRSAHDPVFIDRDPEIFSVLLSLLRSNRLPSTAKHFSNQELIDEALYFGIESQLRAALAPSRLNGIDASLFTTVKPSSDGVVSDFDAIESDGSLWAAHGGQITVYDWNLSHTSTVRTHLDIINSVKRIQPDIAAIASLHGSGLHFYNMANGRRVHSTEWVDPSDVRIYKARVHAIADSVDSVFASYDCQHGENCVLMIDKSTMKISSEIGRMPGNSSKHIVPTKLKYVSDLGVLVGSSVTSGAFGYSGYIRLWDPRTQNVVWETNEPGAGRSSRFGDSMADVDVDLDDMALFKICSKSGDLAMADLRKLTDDPWLYLKEKNPSLRDVGRNGGGNFVIHCYRKQVFVGREGELEVWSRVEENENERIVTEEMYRRNYVDKVEDSERGAIKKIEGGGDRLFVTREDVEGIECYSINGRRWNYLGVLIWMDILAIYAMYIMMTYLTNVWKLGFTHAAAVLNVFWGVVTILPIFHVFIVDAIMGNYWMLLFSSMAYSAGLGLLTMSTPPVLAHSMGTCSEYVPECIGDGQKMLFYAALAFIAIGMSGHLTSLGSFMTEQFVQVVVNLIQNDVDADNIFRMFWRSFLSGFAVFIAGCAAVLALPYIKPWSLRFGIPAICTLLATVLFVSGSCSYRIIQPAGSPLTTFVRVFVAAISKLFHPTPRDARELYEIQAQDNVPHTRSLRFLDKASIVIPTKPLEEQKRNRWNLCRVTEVEETKTIIRMIPVWMTFILCGVVSAIGFSYFIEQLNHLNPKVGRLKVPIVVLLWFYEQAQNKFAEFYASFANLLDFLGLKRFAPTIGIAISMILAILCCITAAKVEHRRLGVVQKHSLFDKPNETVPMTMFWLLPQFLLLGAFDGTFRYSAICFFVDQSPVSTQRYLPFLVIAVYGVGIIGSVVSVFVVGKVSERGGKTSWFQHNLNGSRLDKYYWTLAWLMAINLVIFVVIAILYRHKESRLRDQQGEEFGGIDEEPYSDNQEASSCCC